MSVTVSSRSRDTWLGGVVPAVKDVAAHNELLRMLIVKDLKIKYKASAIGLFWSLLNPLLMMLVYTAIFGTIFGAQKPEFPIYVLSGLLAWTFFGTTLPAATTSVVANSNLVKKTRFPTSLLPSSVALSGLVNFVISLVLLFGLVAVYRHPLGPSLLLLPVLVFAETCFVIGLGLLLSSLNVFFRDVEHFLGIVLTVWFFATPIIYPREQIHGNELASTIIKVNPMTWLVESYQDIFYGSPDAVHAGTATTYLGTFTTTWPNPRPLLGFIALSLALLVVGFVTFVRLSHRFVEEV
ncbi:MAG: lipopolysaccharide transport system permease protein [Chloroflexota bacterium]|jgi:ABC-2 type transport system permease protein|nr:lipopolysaccharide transport system permease protein [Chloroflexota bacterium]